MNARSAQLVAAALGFLLIVLVGAVIFVLLGRPSPRPDASPSASATTAAAISFTPAPVASPSALTPVPATLPSSPSPVATIAPTPTAPPTATAGATPDATPEITPVVTPVATATPTAMPTDVPTVAPTAAPTDTPVPTIAPTVAPTLPPVPTSPGRQIRVLGLGIDGRNPDIGVQRYVLFHVDGPSVIRATLSNSSGRARVCLWQGNEIEERTCETIRNGTLERAVFEAGQTTWTLSLLGSEQALGPVLDLTVDFNALDPQVIFENLRFQGAPNPNYNGITVEVDALDAGDLSVTGRFDPGQQYPARVVIERLGEGGGVEYDETTAPSNMFTLTWPLSPATSYRTSVTNPNEQSEPGSVFLQATFSWP